MFAENKKISAKQLMCQIITENTAIVCVMSGHLASVAHSIWYIFVYPVMMCLSYFYLWMVMKKINKKVDNVTNALITLRFTIMGSFGVYVLYKLLKDILLKGNYWWVIILTIGALCLYISRHTAEERGRIHEILIYFVMIPILIILAFATFKASFYVEEFNISARLLTVTLITFFCGNSYESILIYEYHIENDESFKKIMIRIPLVIFGLGAFVYGICALLFGENATILKLMDVGGIPGGFFNRQESVMAIFVVISLTSYISGMFYVVRQCVKNIFLRNKRKSANIINLLVYGLLVAIMLFSGVFIKGIEKKSDEGISGADDIENYDFVKSIIVNENEGIIIEVDKEYYTYSTKDIDKMCEEHMENGNNRLNFSHVSGIMFCDTKHETEEEMIDTLEEDIRFSCNILVMKSSDKTNEFYDNVVNKKDYSLSGVMEKLSKNVSEYKNSRLYEAGR